MKASNKVLPNLSVIFTLIVTCIFSAQAQNWTQLGDDIDGEAAEDRSGTGVSLNGNGNIVAIGAFDNDGNGPNSGHVRVYEWNESAWVQRGSDMDGEAANDNSGRSVCLNNNGDIVAIGADDNDENGMNAGHVRVYRWNGSDWLQMGSDIDGEGVGDYSGYCVSLDSTGEILAIGAPANNGNGSNSGQVRVYEWDEGLWVQKGSDMDGEAAEDSFGRSVSLNNSGDILAVGATKNDGNGSEAGHVRVYSWNGSAWLQMGDDIDGEAAADRSGVSVSLNSHGNLVAIGAYWNGGNGSTSGHVRIFEWNGSAWVQRGSDIDGDAAGDQSGFSVSLNSTGDIVAIGSVLNSNNGTYAGHVRIFEWNGSTWAQRGLDIDGEAAGDQSGFSVSLSSTGDIVAIGAILNSDNGTYAGHVRVFTTQSINTDIAVVEKRFFSVYPNPTNSVLTIESGVSDRYIIDITSLKGQVLYSTEMGGSYHQLDLSNFQKGVYFITIRSDGIVARSKIILLK
jgi:hypothetical protein